MPPRCPTPGFVVILHQFLLQIVSLKFELIQRCACLLCFLTAFRSWSLEAFQAEKVQLSSFLSGFWKQVVFPPFRYPPDMAQMAHNGQVFGQGSVSPGLGG
eukprot:EG_transcript_35184